MTIADSTMRTMHAALGGLAKRAEARSANFANAETPGYQARRVDFEAELARAIDNGQPDRVVRTTTRMRETLPDIHGNTVDLEHEMVEMLTDKLRYDTVIAAYNYKTNVFRSAIGGR